MVRKASVAFEESAKDEELDNEVTRGEVDWLTLAPKKRLISLEDAKAKSQRLRDEGGTLAEAERLELRCKADDRQRKKQRIIILMFETWILRRHSGHLMTSKWDKSKDKLQLKIKVKIMTVTIG